MEVLMWLMTFLGPGIAGAAMFWFSNRCRGKNAKNFFKFGAWGFWLLYLWWVPNLLPIPLLGPVLWLIIKMSPTVICFFLAVSSILKEMRAQKDGEYTEAA
ncbi:MAG TPA: hypothetical protein VKU00_15525 [Chthonomonadaceae bacterium]|nr:hypothetical protein [Chthonomonadaceae bacterium]